MSQPDGGGDPYFKNMAARAAERAAEDRDAWKRHAQTSDRELAGLRKVNAELENRIKALELALEEHRHNSFDGRFWLPLDRQR